LKNTKLGALGESKNFKENSKQKLPEGRRDQMQRPRKKEEGLEMGIKKIRETAGPKGGVQEGREDNKGKRGHSRRGKKKNNERRT